MRCHDLLVAEFLLNAFQEIFQAKTQGGAFGQPDGQPLADGFAEHEELQFFAYLAVVAFLGFFKQYQVFIQHFFLGESDAVDTGHLLAFFITAPVGSGYG